MKDSLFGSYLQNTHEWLKAISQYGVWESQSKSLSALRVTLHHIRDHLTVENSAHFAAQLPLIIKGIYYDGWVPTHVPIKERNAQDFIESIAVSLQSPTLYEALTAIEAVLKTLQDYVSKGEIEKVQHVLPKTIRHLWEQTYKTHSSVQTGSSTPSIP